jgi:DNA-binding MarR family transcriptional regulator
MKERTNVGFLVKQINNIYEKDFNNQLKKLDLTSSQAEVLDYLFRCDEEEVNQKDIEKALSLKNPTVTGILKRMEEKGFVMILPSEKDKRCKNVYLTEQAFDIEKKMEAARRKVDKSLTLGMTKREVQALQKMLNRVLYNVSEP